MTKVEETKNPREELMSSLEAVMSELALTVKEQALQIAADAGPNLVLAALGIDTDSYGRERFVNLDRCNGYVGIMARLIKDFTKEQVERHGPALTESFLKHASKRERDSMKVAPFVKMIRQEYKEEYLNSLREYLVASVKHDVEAIKKEQDALVRSSVEGINGIFSPDNEFLSSLMHDLEKESGSKISGAMKQRLAKILRVEDDYDDYDKGDDHDEEDDLIEYA